MRCDPHTTDPHHSRRHTGSNQTVATETPTGVTAESTTGAVTWTASPAAAARVRTEEAAARNEPCPAATHPAAGEDVELNVVSKHPDATIPESDISLADIERKRAHPLRTLCYIVLVLAALILPYWAGRTVGVQHTAWVVECFGAIDPRAIALVSWSITVFAVLSVIMLIIDRIKTLWFTLFVVLLCIEQFIGGVAMLRFDFWHSTYVIYGGAARVAIAADLGIIAAGLALAVFAVVWVGLLITIKKDSPLNVLTHVWTSLILLLVFETVALLIVMFGGLLTVV